MPPSNPKEAKLDEDANKSIDLDVSANQSALEDIDKCQNDLDSLNEKASEEILAVEQKYNKLRRPYYEKRNRVIEAIPNFWCNALTNHPQIAVIVGEEEQECLKSLKSVDVEEFDDIKSGYKITMNFGENSYFKNTQLVKEFHLVSTIKPESKSTPIEWKEGKDLIKQSQSQPKGRKRPMDDHNSFFSWFVNNEEPNMDEIAETIKDDIWVSPLQYYLGSELENGHSDDDEEDDDDDVVEIGDENSEDDDEDPEMFGEGEEDDDEEGEDDDEEDDEDEEEEE